MTSDVTDGPVHITGSQEIVILDSYAFARSEKITELLWTSLVHMVASGAVTAETAIRSMCHQWLVHLDEDNTQRCIAELTEYLEEGDRIAFFNAYYPWESTAEIYGDPVLLAQLLRDTSIG